MITRLLLATQAPVATILIRIVVGGVFLTEIRRSFNVIPVRLGIADAPDLGFRNNRFQNVGLRFKKQSFYERKSRVFHEIDFNANGEQKTTHSSTNSSTQMRQTSPHLRQSWRNFPICARDKRYGSNLFTVGHRSCGFEPCRLRVFVLYKFVLTIRHERGRGCLMASAI